LPQCRAIERNDEGASDANNPSPARRWLNTSARSPLCSRSSRVAKSAIAEPYYVPSGSMEPTLLVGDELLATKFPYGYSSASLPLSIAWPRTERILGALPAARRRGRVSPSGQSLAGLGQTRDRAAGRSRADAHGRLWINGEPVELKHDGRR